MKRYTLNAEFVRWKAPDRSESELESMTYVLELESEEEAKTRLDTLIIERMSSRQGWSYLLLASGYTEFSEESTSTELVSMLYENLSTTEPAIINPPNPEYNSEIPTIQEQEIAQNNIEEDSIPNVEKEMRETSLESDQLQV